MGGTLPFLTGTRDLGLAGVIGFYEWISRMFAGFGTWPDQIPNIRYPLLGLFGGADQSIPQDRVETLDQDLDAAGIEHEIVIYPGAPHSFFDRRATEYAHASADAWKLVLGVIDARAAPLIGDVQDDSAPPVPCLAE